MSELPVKFENYCRDEISKLDTSAQSSLRDGTLTSERQDDKSTIGEKLATSSVLQRKQTTTKPPLVREVDEQFSKYKDRFSFPITVDTARAIQK